MALPPKVKFPKDTYYVYKTGIPFYDAARVIGVAHLFFGTASAEVEDKGAYWEVRGIPVKRDEEQILWIVERLSPKKWERELFQKGGKFCWQELNDFFKEQSLENRNGRSQALKAEFDAALQIGTRGIDPLSKYEVLAPRSTGETLKKFKDRFQEVAVATLGRAFAARATREIYILPIFSKRFVMSGFLEYERSFNHACGGWVAAILAALSILLDLTAQGLPVVDFAYTREVKSRSGQPIFSDSGYLGLEKLCSYWRQSVRENRKSTLDLLKNFRAFLRDTQGPSIDEQNQALARLVAYFVANPRAEVLMKIEQLKARIMASYKKIPLIFNRSEHIKEVKAMIQPELPEVPWQVSEALARALRFDEKGWMNQFTRLENATNFSQLIRQVENIISRGYYREQQEKGEAPSIQQALTRAHDLANNLKVIESKLQDEKAFRAWKAIFLLDVLSRARIRPGASSGEGEEETTTMEEV